MEHDKDKNGIGEPVTTYKKPNVGKKYPIETPPESDEFNTSKIRFAMAMARKSSSVLGFSNNVWDIIQCIVVQYQKKQLIYLMFLIYYCKNFHPNEFTATAKMTFNARFDGERTGLVIMGLDYSYLKLKQDSRKIISFHKKTVKMLIKKE